MAVALNALTLAGTPESLTVVFHERVKVGQHAVEVGREDTAPEVRLSQHAVEVGRDITAPEVKLSQHVIEIGWWIPPAEVRLFECAWKLIGVGTADFNLLGCVWRPID